jgi:hypothetical protein
VFIHYLGRRSHWAITESYTDGELCALDRFGPCNRAAVVELCALDRKELQQRQHGMPQVGCNLLSADVDHTE